MAYFGFLDLEPAYAAISTKLDRTQPASEESTTGESPSIALS
jgi:hypothetical protein